MKKKNKKNNKKKLSALLLLLFLTIVMLATSTYAWFTANKTVSIEDITVNVATSAGLQISTDAKNWKTVIKNTDITNPTAWTDGNTNQFPSNLVPVSTAGNVDANGLMEMFTGNVESQDGDFKLTATKNTEVKGTTGNFVAFDIFIKTELSDEAKKAGRDYETVYLTTTSGVLVPSDDTDAGLQNAARVAFVNEGNASSDTAVGTLQQMKADGTADDYAGVTIWEPNDDTHNGNGINNALSYYSHISEVSSLGAGTGNTKLPYDGIKAAFTDGILLSEGNATDNENTFSAVTTIGTAKTQTASTEILQLKSGVTKFRVYLWVEGQDVDCENNASGHSITFNIALTLNKVDATASGSEG